MTQVQSNLSPEMIPSTLAHFYQHLKNKQTPVCHKGMPGIIQDKALPLNLYLKRLPLRTLSYSSLHCKNVIKLKQEKNKSG